MAAPVQEIEGLLQALSRAVSDADPTALEATMSEDVTWVFSGEAAPVRGVRAVMRTWAGHLTQWQDVAIRRRETVVRVRGDVAWGCFLWDGEGSAGDRRYRLEGERWSFVLTCVGSAWRFASVHSSMPYREWEAHRIEGR